MTMLLPPTTVSVNADVGVRTLYLYHTHTRETARITFKRNGAYDRKGLEQLNWFLRDWRNNQTTTMAPQLFDLIWEVYQKVGATQPVNIVSSYRSPKTNAMLRARSSGVASNSQHMLGHAMDFFIPGVPLTRLRQVAMQQQVGGVGFYPTSGSPFVHLDVGTVRAWPRMTQAQLQQIFPDGKTMHIPTNGKLLSQAGYAYAKAQWNACHAVPCTNGAAVKGGADALGRATMVAAATTSASGKSFADISRGVDPGNSSVRNPGNIMTAEADDESGDASATAGPSQRAVMTVALAAPMPLLPPADLRPARTTDTTIVHRAAGVAFDSLFPTAYDATTPPPGPTDVPVPAQKSYGLMVATGEPTRGVPAQSAVAAIASIEAPTPLAPLQRPADTDVTLSAYAPAPSSAAESALEAIIERETTGILAMSAAGSTALTNSVSSPLGAAALKSFAAERRDRQAMPRTAAPVQLASFKTRDTALVSPGFSVAMVAPVAMSSATFARLSEPTAADLDPATELGPMVARLGFLADSREPLGVNHFAPGTALLVASR